MNNLLPLVQFAADSAKEAVKKGITMPGSTGTSADLPTLVSQITSIIFLILGIVAVFVIILGGFNMMTSAGDPGKVKKGKDTILWGIIGLIVAILAYAIVKFVVDKL